MWHFSWLSYLLALCTLNPEWRPYTATFSLSGSRWLIGQHIPCVYICIWMYIVFKKKKKTTIYKAHFKWISFSCKCIQTPLQQLYFQSHLLEPAVQLGSLQEWKQSCQQSVYPNQLKMLPFMLLLFNFCCFSSLVLPFWSHAPIFLGLRAGSEFYLIFQYFCCWFVW